MTRPKEIDLTDWPDLSEEAQSFLERSWASFTKEEILDIIKDSRDYLQRALAGEKLNGEYTIRLDMSEWGSVNPGAGYCKVCLAGLYFIQTLGIQRIDYKSEGILDFLNGLRLWYPGGSVYHPGTNWVYRALGILGLSQNIPIQELGEYNSDQPEAVLRLLNILLDPPKEEMEVN